MAFIIMQNIIGDCPYFLIFLLTHIRIKQRGLNWLIDLMAPMMTLKVLSYGAEVLCFMKNVLLTLT